MNEFVGVYGGAFDPPHKAHIDTAMALIEERGYDKLILLPSHNPPHKSLCAKDSERIDMLKLVAGDKMIVSDIEIKRKGVGYTVQYLPEIIKEYGDNVEYIIGGDSFLNFDNWYKPKEILKLTKILVVARDKQKKVLETKLQQYCKLPKKSIEIAKFMPKSMSSSEIRNALRLHLDTKDFLSDSVLQYISEHNLYNEYGHLITKLAENVSEERFQHTQRVVLFALDYVQKLGLDYNKVFVSCLLHDCAKNKDLSNIYERNLVPQDSKGTPIAHAFCGAVVASEEYGIVDEEILDAIFCHATAKPDMTTLAKLVYSADMLECGRDFEGVQQLREIFEKDFEQGFYQCLKATVQFLEEKGGDIYPLTLEAYKYYKDKNKE